MLGWGGILRLCLVNMALGGLAALPVNLFNRLMTVELALPALLPGLLVALHYAVQLSRPVWGHRSDRGGARAPFILGGLALLGAAITLAAWGVGLAERSLPMALLVWTVAYVAIGIGVAAAGTSFLALLAAAAPGHRRGAAATFAWLFLILGAILGSVGTGAALEPYSPARLVTVVAAVAAIAVVLAAIGVLGAERKVAVIPPPEGEGALGPALRAAWADRRTRAFTGFVFLSILAYYLSELVFEPFAGHVHGLSPEESTTLSGGKDGAALLGMIAAGALSTFGLLGLRGWAILGCGVSAAGLLALGAGTAILPATVILGLGNGMFVVGAVGSMMRLAAEAEGRTGVRMGVFGAAQAIAAGLAGLVATATLDLFRLILDDAAAYGLLFAVEAALFVAAAAVAAQVLRPAAAPVPVPGE